MCLCLILGDYYKDKGTIIYLGYIGNMALGIL